MDCIWLRLVARQPSLLLLLLFLFFVFLLFLHHSLCILNLARTQNRHRIAFATNRHCQFIFTRRHHIILNALDHVVHDPLDGVVVDEQHNRVTCAILFPFTHEFTIAILNAIRTKSITTTISKMKRVAPFLTVDNTDADTKWRALFIQLVDAHTNLRFMHTAYEKRAIHGVPDLLLAAGGVLAITHHRRTAIDLKFLRFWVLLFQDNLRGHIRLCLGIGVCVCVFGFRG
mmetsp:Transcript_44373/g.73436  ORF Transcript_44373/g.73436 Transcript_44373/m.73436 type:complete len:229 (-) Transcript_44373:204-890(-)